MTRGSGEMRGVSADVVVTWLGYGCLLCLLSFGPQMLVMPEAGALSRGTGVLVQAFHLAGVAAGCWAVGACVRSGRLSMGRVSSAVTVALLWGALLAMGFATANGAPGVVLPAALWLAQGMCVSYFLLFWMGRLVRLHRGRGRRCCLGVLVTAELVPVFVSAGFAAMPEGSWQACVVLAVAMAMTCGCQATLVRSRSGDCAPDRTPRRGARASAPGGPAPARQYRLSAYSCAVLSCLGVVWGLAAGLCAHVLGSSSGPSFLALTAAETLAVVLATLVAVGCVGSSLQFGGLVRLALVAVGSAFALVPLMRGFLAPYADLACEMVFIFVEMTVALFSVEVSCEHGLPAISVVPRNYAAYSACALLGLAVACVTLALVPAPTDAELISAASTLAVLGTIPFLPSRRSDASTFTLSELPEDEGYDDYVRRRRDRLAERLRLTWREGEVLELMLRGMTRGQIADELSLSPWTVKDRTTSIYRKAGVHSYKELLGLIESDEA